MEILYLLIAVLAIILMTTKLKIHAFLALFIISICYGIFAGMPYSEIILSINEGFGGTLGKIGLIIVLGVLSVILFPYPFLPIAGLCCFIP